MDDAAAIRSCQGGCTEDFRHLVERYQGEAMAHASAILGNRSDALDAVQDAFLAAFQALPRFDLSRPFYPWLYTILRHRCFRLLGERRGRGLALEDAGPLLAPSPGARGADLEALEPALKALEPEERELIVLKHLDGLTYAEIAGRLEVPEGTVMSRLFHARKRLAQHLRRTS